jgi:hypothetical protein
VLLVHTERTGRTEHETVLIHSVRVCDGCQAALAWPGAVLTHQPCSCVPEGHTAWFCFGCRTWTYDPTCTDPVRGMGSLYG